MKKVYICKYGDSAFIGDTASEAYSNYIDEEFSRDIVSPEKMDWYEAVPMALTMTVTPINDNAHDNEKGEQ